MSIGFTGLSASVQKDVTLTTGRSDSDLEHAAGLLVEALEVDGLQSRGACPAHWLPILKGRSVQRDHDRTDQEVAQLILHNCHQMGETPQAAQEMVERCLENRRKSAFRVILE